MRVLLYYIPNTLYMMIVLLRITKRAVLSWKFYSSLTNRGIEYQLGNFQWTFTWQISAAYQMTNELITQVKLRGRFWTIRASFADKKRWVSSWNNSSRQQNANHNEHCAAEISFFIPAVFFRGKKSANDGRRFAGSGSETLDVTMAGRRCRRVLFWAWFFIYWRCWVD